MPFFVTKLATKHDTTLYDMITFQAFKKQFSQKGLQTGDLSSQLLLHELQIDQENLHKLVDLPADTLLSITISTTSEEA